MNTQTDTITEFIFDPRANRYRVSKGAGSGRFISKQAFINSVNRQLATEEKLLISIGEQLINKNISIRDFQIEVSKRVKNLHLLQSILGANGLENISSENWLIVSRELKKQYYTGRDWEDQSKRFGIKRFTKDILDGKVSEKQLINRLRMYAAGSKISYWNQIEFRDNAKPYAYRKLNPADHCSECLAYAMMGIRKKSQIPKPTQKCSCRSNCKCDIFYLSLSEAVAMSENTGLSLIK